MLGDFGGTLKISGSITVAKGGTLTLGPGLEVRAAANAGTALYIKGTLKAEGTAAEPIIFSSVLDKDSGEWAGIKLEAGSGASVLDHVEIRRAGTAITASSNAQITNSSILGNWAAVVVSSGASPQITHDLIEDNRGSFKTLEVVTGGAPEIAYNTFIGNGAGGTSYHALYYATTSSSQTGEINIHNNVFENNQGNAITVSTGSSPVKGTTLGDNLINGNSGRALLYSGADIPGDVSKNYTEGNEVDAIQVAGTVAHSSTWELGGAPVLFSGTVVVAKGITLTLMPGIYIQSPQMTVYGALRSEGTNQRPVTLTGTAQIEAGEWGGITLEPGGGESVVDYTEISFGGLGRPTVSVKGVSPKITHSTFRRSSGDAIRVQQSGQPIIEGNRFRNNQFGLRYEGEGKLAAPRNDWGCSNGPQPSGCGDPVSSNVEWQPAIVLQELPRLCPGATFSASAVKCLLSRYEPTLQYDSEENYFADDVRGIAENWGDSTGLWGTSGTGSYSNRLFDKDYETGQANGKLIGESRPQGEGEYRLTLDLVSALYPNTLSADSNDWLDENNDYLADSKQLEENGFMHAAYGEGETDSDGKRWLEYWYWYYYNPHNYAGVGNHEGDWESVLIGLDSNNRPDIVVLSQHESPVSCTPTEMETTSGGAPIVFVGVGSHANFPRPGTYAAPFALDNDYADGNGEAVQPGLVDMTDYPPAWTAWPGHWGNSQSTFKGEGTSPQGPHFHAASAPSMAYAESAGECEVGLNRRKSQFLRAVGQRASNRSR